MGKSKTVRVTVSPKSTVLSINVGRTSGLPGDILIWGTLKEAGTILPIVIYDRLIQLWVNGERVATRKTDPAGQYRITWTVKSGVYDFYAKFPGDDTYTWSGSPHIPAVYEKIETSLSIDVNPLFGAPPLAITLLGMLSRDDTLGGLPGKTVELYRNGVKLKSMTTKTTSPGQGAYEFHDKITAIGEYDYYVYFAGDSQFEGCEAHAGATADGELPPDDDEEKVGVGVGALVLAALILSGDEK